jgi:hypothetical protein
MTVPHACHLARGCLPTWTVWPGGAAPAAWRLGRRQMGGTLRRWRMPGSASVGRESCAIEVDTLRGRGRQQARFQSSCSTSMHIGVVELNKFIKLPQLHACSPAAGVVRVSTHPYEAKLLQLAACGA